MARITMVTDTCTRKVSPDCEGTFSYERKPGRPPISCKPCRAAKVVQAPKAKATPQVAEVRPTKGTCGCGNTFDIQPRGRISNRCEDCRTSGTVWRTDDDGMVQMIQAAQISREEQERKDALGSERAKNLVERMKLLLEKNNRTVIVH